MKTDFSVILFCQQMLHYTHWAKQIDKVWVVAGGNCYHRLRNQQCAVAWSRWSQKIIIFMHQNSPSYSAMKFSEYLKKMVHIWWNGHFLFQAIIRLKICKVIWTETFILVDGNLSTKMNFGILFWILYHLLHKRKNNNSQN